MPAWRKSRRALCCRTPHQWRRVENRDSRRCEICGYELDGLTVHNAFRDRQIWAHLPRHGKLGG